MVVLDIHLNLQLLLLVVVELVQQQLHLFVVLLNLFLLDAGGSSYTSKPTVVLSSGSGAVAQAIVNNGRIISIAIISAGSGYTTAPEVTIQGDGFGAVARATIDVDGENAGRVTGIEIINRGINYIQGTTVINLTSVGQDATFTANVFQWTYNLQETTTFDSAKGAVFLDIIINMVVNMHIFLILRD